VVLELARALEVARTVAAEAAELLREAAGNIGRVAHKGNPRDLITEWDTRTEDLIRARLAELTPGVPLLGEERGAAGGDGDERWLIDPIDGTVNFAHGLPHFAVAVALEQHGRPVVGVIRVPAHGWEFHAAAGAGAFHDGEPMRVSRVARLDQALLATGFPYDRATNPANNFAEWEHFQRTAGACRRFGVASLDLAFVARGWFDGYWETRLAPWDLAAGAVLVQEAGGRVTGIEGQPFVAATGHAVATNGAIHNDVLDELAAVRSRRERHE
jgi:myo-inositol-1(or 4)-monophosphatase